MKPPISAQDEDALNQKQDHPTEHGKTMNDDQGNDLPGNFASSETLPMRKKQTKSNYGRNQHHASGDHIEEPFGLQSCPDRG
jgi:hypothetical protein